MAYVTSDFREAINRWFEWELRLDNMSEFPMLDRYKASKSTNEYDRFVGFVKEWAFERMKSAEKRPNPENSGEIIGFNFREKNDIINNTTEEAFAMLSFNEIGEPKIDQTLDERVNNPDRFWKVAMASRGNKKINKAMPSIQGNYTKPVYSLFMPAYRALKDRFEQRSFWQWFTNHAQYTAERDCIRALEGIMRSLTGDSLAKVTEQLNIMRERMPVKDFDTCVRLEEERLDKIEAAQRTAKKSVVHDNNKVSPIVINEANQTNVNAISEPIVESDEIQIEKNI